jgi:hypothetical protein
LSEEGCLHRKQSAKSVEKTKSENGEERTGRKGKTHCHAHLERPKKHSDWRTALYAIGRSMTTQVGQDLLHLVLVKERGKEAGSSSADSLVVLPDLREKRKPTQ